MLLTDTHIHLLAEDGMIRPYCPRLHRETEHGPALSFGQSSAGYDMRLGQDFLVCDDEHARSLGWEHPRLTDPKAPDTTLWRKVCLEPGQSLRMPPHGLALGRSLEYWRIPTRVAAVVWGKSTYARCGLHVNCTPMEPGWEGHLTIELTNQSPYWLVVYPGEGIAQAQFWAIAKPDVAYSERANRYQGQTGVTQARV